MEYITDKPIKLSEHVDIAHDPKAGAVVLFSGETRNHSQGRAVDYLEYEAHIDMAQKTIKEIISEAKNKWPLYYAHCTHRIGRVDISETAVVVVTSSAHRKDAYDANRYIIDRVKKEAPIWKKEYFSDGKESWQ